MPYVIAMIVMALWSSQLVAQDTELKLYRPFGEEMSHGRLIVSHQVGGVCIQQSMRIKREDAWRCIAAGKTYDPCFVRKFGSHLEAVCPASPWAGNGVLVKLDRPADNNDLVELDMSKTYPWAVELATGEKCEAIDDDETYDNLPVRYRCDSQTVLIGHLQRCKATWTILQRGITGQVTTAAVKKAWF
ncbi:hypothetical protein [Legionella spiritensis]|uniref:hypothetical protein n=1 Tax=Legionella spiritensis TaxID=452 RepID=UPI000F6C127C|nr:hypothetical protein [Legionella spiritensis]VEG89617.1 Uncharacterised protein [Legionella spiritensis]